MYTGAAFDLGLASRKKSNIRTFQAADSDPAASASQMIFPQQAAMMGEGQPSEQFDQDRINSLDNSLSAAERFKGFARYRAKYGRVASFGSAYA